MRQGVELVRRDNCKWAKTVYERVLKGWLYEMIETKFRQYLENELARLVLKKKKIL